ncbi:MAG: nucleotide exchange factor GrpE [Alphaproteobacteria bacterium]|nr:nucleotide exchange factor GrpE [Alphaproteobacteria bacterium]
MHNETTKNNKKEREYEQKTEDMQTTESMETNEISEDDIGNDQEDNVSNQKVKNSTKEDKYKSQIEELNKIVVSIKDQLLRTMAELQNVKKRHEIEKVNISNFSITAFAKDVLSIRDNLCLALANCKDNSNAIVEGVKMTLKHLDKILDSYNIRIIVSLNKKFDPNYHQAMSEAVSDKDPGTIIQVMQEGFMIKDRLLRPALVIVSKSK